MEDAKAVATSVDTSTKLVKAKESDECADQQQYQSAIGICCIWLWPPDQTSRLQSTKWQSFVQCQPSSTGLR